VRQRFFEAVDQRQDVDVEIIKATAIGVCEESGGRYRAFLEGGPPIGADVVLLATAYGLPSAGAYGALPPYEVIDRQRLAGAKSMALIGSGLTMVDVLIGARRDGFSGTATVFSRRGQLPPAPCAERRSAEGGGASPFEAYLAAHCRCPPRL
jgi:uncharacterized NAD(P)/FAD-binding protein YdhS